MMAMPLPHPSNAAGRRWTAREVPLFERWRPGGDRPDVITSLLGWHPAGAADSFKLDLLPFFAEVFGE